MKRYLQLLLEFLIFEVRPTKNAISQTGRAEMRIVSNVLYHNIRKEHTL